MIRIAIVDDEVNVLKYISDKITETLKKFKYDAKIVMYTIAIHKNKTAVDRSGIIKVGGDKNVRKTNT